MDVGVNYPWYSYGYDFGEAPPNWRKTPKVPDWDTEINFDLKYLQDLGISVVRWFILADGLTYGSNQDAPTKGRSQLGSTRWRFNPPALSQLFREDFQCLLEAFARANFQAPQRPIKLLPVLIDYKFCQDGDVVCDANHNPIVGWVKRGRADVVIDKTKRSTFFDNVLEPLLKDSKVYKNIIYAWDIFNEPEWVTGGWHPKYFRPLCPIDQQILCPVDQTDMAKFLKEGIERVSKRGFEATVGFATINTIYKVKDNQSKNNVFTGIFAGLNQFHHYQETTWTEQRLASLNPPPTPTGSGKCPQWPAMFIGEFATLPDKDIWPELKWTGQSVLNRLGLIRDMGYPLALAWRYKTKKDDVDKHGAWSTQVADDIECFLRRK